MIARTRISRLLAGYRDEPRADIDGVIATLEALSAIAADLPDVVELDINPLRVDAQGVMALDARIVISQDPSPGAPGFVPRAGQVGRLGGEPISPT